MGMVLQRQRSYLRKGLCRDSNECCGTGLNTNRRQRRNITRAKVPFLLKGIVFGSDGRALTPWFTRTRNGRLYRYYLPARDNKEHARASRLPHLPAAQLEAAVLEQAHAIPRATGIVVDVVARTRLGQLDDWLAFQAHRKLVTVYYDHRL